MAGLLFFITALISCPHPIALLSAIAIHECGHIICAALLGFGRPKFSLSPAGFKISYYKNAGSLSTLAVILSGCFFGALFSLLPFLPPEFRLYSAGFAAMNILPISCLDGGCALVSLLEVFILPDRSYKIARAVSVVFTLLFWVITLAVQMKAGVNITLLCVCVYLTVLVSQKGKP